MSQQSTSSDARLAIDFEITFAALLATGLLTFSNQTFPTAAYVAAFGLLIVTIIRRMAIIGDHANTDRVMLATNPFMEGFSVFAVVYFLTLLASKNQIVTTGDSALLEFVLGCLAVALIAILFQEFAFHDFFNWWTKKFASISEEKDDLWAYASAHAGSISTAPPPPESERHKIYRLVGVEYLAKDQPSFEPTWLWIKQLVVASKYIMLPAIVLFVMARATSVQLTGISLFLVALFLFLGLGLIEDHVKYLYMTYGNASELKTDAEGYVERGVNEIRKPGFTQAVYVFVVFILLN